MRTTLLALELAALCTLAGCQRLVSAPDASGVDAGPTTPIAVASAEPAVTPEKAAYRAARDASSLAEAFKLAPFSKEERTSLGTLAIEAWALKHVTWQDFDIAKNETSGALALKDIAAARGKRLCVEGRISSIKARDLEGAKTYDGVLITTQSRYQFFAVGSTGELVVNNVAKFCGAVTEIATVENMQFVNVVGMFDLADNRARK